MSLLPTLASLVLTAPFWWSGISKLSDFNSARAEVRDLRLGHPALVAGLVVVVQLLGSVLVVAGQGLGQGLALWTGAAALAAFTLAASYRAHPFWKASAGTVRTSQRNAFIANMGLVGGLMMAVVAKGADLQ